MEKDTSVDKHTCPIDSSSQKSQKKSKIVINTILKDLKKQEIKFRDYAEDVASIPGEEASALTNSTRYLPFQKRAKDESLDVYANRWPVITFGAVV